VEEGLGKPWVSQLRMSGSQFERSDIARGALKQNPRITGTQKMDSAYCARSLDLISYFSIIRLK